MKLEENQIALAELPDEELLQYLGTDYTERVQSILYDRYVKKVYFKAISLLKNKAEAKDLTHDIFIKIFTKIDQFKGNSKLSLWIHSISVNTCINYLNKKKKNVFVEVNEFEPKMKVDPFHEKEEKVIYELKAKQLLEIMNSLTQEERLLMIMKYTDGLAVKDIVNILSLSTSAVKMRLMRTREKIANLYEEKYGKYQDI